MSGPVVTLIGGPWDRQVFYVSDWEERRRAAERMGRSADELCGCALAYRPEAPNSLRWIWAGGDPAADEVATPRMALGLTSRAGTSGRPSGVLAPEPACAVT